MLNVKIWVKNAYPFDGQATENIVKTIRRMHGVHSTYYSPWHAHWIEIEDISMAQAKQVANTIKAIHLYQAIKASRPESRVTAEDVEVEVRGRGDSPPEWAR